MDTKTHHVLVTLTTDVREDATNLKGHINSAVRIRFNGREDVTISSVEPLDTVDPHALSNMQVAIERIEQILGVSRDQSDFDAQIIKDIAEYLTEADNYDYGTWYPVTAQAIRFLHDYLLYQHHAKEAK